MHGFEKPCPADQQRSLIAHSTRSDAATGTCSALHESFEGASLRVLPQSGRGRERIGWRLPTFNPDGWPVDALALLVLTVGGCAFAYVAGALVTAAYLISTWNRPCSAADVATD
jgi:hypothetical protein